MGLFSSIFGGDPTKDLAKAERLLADGEARRALDLARKALDAGQEAVAAGARTVIGAARQELVRRALERTATAEASEYWADAAEWLDEAIEHADEGSRAELETRRADLLERARKAELEPELDLDAYRSESDAGGEEADFEGDAGLFHNLIDMMEDEVADQYEAQSGAFEKAYLAFHEGRFEQARELFELLVDDDPGNTVARFERGRCRLHDGELAGAREDFEAVWPELGNDPLDRAGHLSVPGLWASTQLGLGEPEPILERLEDLAHPSKGRAEIVLPYSQALVTTEQFEDAEVYLRGTLGSFGSIPDLPWLYANVLAKLDRRDDAIYCLEAAIAPSCSTGNCRRPPLHLPSVRTLIALHLASGEDLDRVRALFELLAQHTQGQLNAEDQQLLALYYRKTGNLEAAEEAMARAGGEATA